MSLVQNPKLFSYFCSLLSRVGIIPIKFQSAAKKTELNAKPGLRTNWNTRLHAIFVAIMIIQGFLQDTNLSLEGVHLWLGVLIHIFSRVFMQEQEKKGHEIAHFCNSLFQFDEANRASQLQQNRAPFRLKLIMMMVYCIVISTLGIPLGFVYGLHWFNPCKVSLVGYWLIPECQLFNLSFIKSNLSIKLVIMLVNHWMASLSINSAELPFVCLQQ